MPPYLRVVEPSACVKALKIFLTVSGSMPIPVSLTSKRSSRESASSWSTLDVQDDLARAR